MRITRRDSLQAVFAISIVAGCGGMLDEPTLAPSSTAEPNAGNESQTGERASSNGTDDPSSAKASPVVPRAVSSCDRTMPFVVEDLQIEGMAPSVTRDELNLVYVHDDNAYERARTPTTGFGPPTRFISAYAMDVAVSPDGLALDYVFLGLPKVEGAASRSTRTARSTPFVTNVPYATPATTPSVPEPGLPVWRVLNVGASTYYSSLPNETLQVVRNGVRSTVSEVARRWFAVSENELVLHHAWFPPMANEELHGVSYRASPDEPFGAPELVQFSMPDGWSPLYVTWVSNDDCVVYGWSMTWDAKEYRSKRVLLRAYRGQ